MDPLVQEAHLAELEQHGVTAIRNAIAPALLEALRSAHDEVCERIRRNAPRSEWSFESDEPGVVDFFRAFELHPCFEELIDLPTVFPVLAAALRGGRGRDPGEPRCGGPVCQYLPAGTGSERWRGIATETSSVSRTCWRTVRLTLAVQPTYQARTPAPATTWSRSSTMLTVHRGGPRPPR